MSFFDYVFKIMSGISIEFDDTLEYIIFKL